MPTVLVVGPYKLVFFSTDRPEPPHIHVLRDKQIAKFWLEPVSLAKNKGFADHELNTVEKLVVEHRETCRKAWDDYFGA